MQSTIRLRAIGAGVLGLVAMLLLYVALMGSASGAGATPTPYCGGQTLGPGATCAGAARNLNAVSGYGDQHQVCVGTIQTGGATSCSAGPGQGASQGYPAFANRTPLIMNSGSGNNTVHGTAYKP
jgi:hypothetical protein